MIASQDVQSALEALLDDPPADEAEARNRLAQADAAALLEALVQRLEGVEPSPEERALAMLMLSVDGPGEHKERLTALALDVTRPRLVRATALLILADHSPEVFAQLSPEDVTLPVEASIEELLEHAAEYSEAVSELADLFTQAPSTARPFLVQTLIRMCEAQRLPPEPLIEPLLRKKALAAQKPWLIEALAQDAGGYGARLLEALAKKGGNATAAPYAEAAARIRARLAQTPAAEGTQAWAVPCDGSGTFQVLVATAGEQRTLAGVLGHVTEGLVDGLFFPRLTQEELDVVLAGLNGQELMPVASVPPAKIAALLADLANRTSAKPWGARMPLAAIGQFETEAFFAPERAAEIDPARIEVLLALPQFRSWLIEPALLPQLPPEAGPERDEWLEEMVMALDKDARQTLSGMVEYNAWWFDAQGDADAAGQLAAAAVELRETPERSQLLRLVLDATARAIYELDIDEDDEGLNSLASDEDGA